MKPPPKHKISPETKLTRKGGRVFNVGNRWVARWKDKQAVGRDADEAAMKILSKFDTG